MKVGKNFANAPLSEKKSGAVAGLPVKFEGSMCPNYHQFKDEVGTYTLRMYSVIGTMFESGTLPTDLEPCLRPAPLSDSKKETKIRHQLYLEQMKEWRKE